ncbi:Uncharacterized protein dnm_050980 [Desulfonema magnum]|uniref:Uncharacterized protein n=1 Tax=Desulfonema magnum TaxID=45655 RepID=A0A975BQ78_9BACT|nr:Uncharacterized protein dnm_050980 [Desulfonema magnum]
MGCPFLILTDFADPFVFRSLKHRESRYSIIKFFCHSCESRNPQPQNRGIGRKRIPDFTGFGVSSVERDDRLSGRIGSKKLDYREIRNGHKKKRFFTPVYENIFSENR